MSRTTPRALQYRPQSPTLYMVSRHRLLTSYDLGIIPQHLIPPLASAASTEQAAYLIGSFGIQRNRPRPGSGARQEVRPRSLARTRAVRSRYKRCWRKDIHIRLVSARRSWARLRYRHAVRGA